MKLTRPFREKYRIMTVMTDETDIIASTATKPVSCDTSDAICRNRHRWRSCFVDKSLNFHKIRNLSAKFGLKWQNSS